MSRTIQIHTGNQSLITNVATASYALTTAGNVENATSASYALTASFASNAASGLSGGSANYIPMWTSATAQSSSTIYQSSGKIGIGTTNPLQILHTKVSSGDNIFRMDTATKAAGVLKLFDSTGDISIQTNSTTDALYIKDAGNVGVGTPAPTQKLEVAGNALIGVGGTGGAIYFGNTGHSISRNGSNDIVVNTSAGGGANTGRIILNDGTGANTGSVGISTATPNYKLSVYGTSVNVGIENPSAAEGWSNTTLGGFVFRTHYNLYEQTGMYAVGDFATNGYEPILVFKTNAVERMRITSAGNVGIGVTNPTYKLDIGGITRVSGSYLSINDRGYIRGDSAGYLVIQGGSTGTLFNNDSNGATLVTILNGGNVGIGTTNPQRGLHVANGNYIRIEGGVESTLELLTGGTFNYVAHGGWGMGANKVGIGDGSSPTMVVDNANDSVGIGTSSPSTKLHVYTGTTSNIAILEGSAGQYLQAGTDGGGFYLEQVGTTSGNRILRIQNSNGSGTYTQLFLHGANQTIYTSANVNFGIGTSSPSYKLDIAGAGSNNVAVRLTPDFGKVRLQGYDLLGYNGGNLWLISNTSVNQLTLGTSWDWDTSCDIYYQPGTTGAAAGVLIIGQTNKNSATWTHGITDLRTNGVSRLYINSSGNVGINTTDFSYTTSDNAGVVSGGPTNNKLFISGSIQLLGNSDAIVFGRGSATFLKDEELGFGWGGGFYMIDGTWIRTRNSTSIWAENGQIGTNGGVTVGYGGNSAPSMGAIFSGSVGIGTMNPTAKLHIEATDVGIRLQENGTSAGWRGRMGSFNSSADRASFLGIYASVAGVFAHNHALNTWADLYVNTVDGAGGGTVRMPSSVLINGSQALHAGNFSSYAVVANSTLNNNIDSDWGQSFTTFDPVPSGTPPVSSANIRTINIGDNYTRRTQLAFPWDSDRAFFRRRVNSWSAWSEFIHSNNYNSYAPTLTGTGASGTWGISITGNAATATSAGSVDFNNLTNKASGTGTYTTTGDFRAPQFIDSVDNFWYLDPNSVSQLWSVQARNLGGANLNIVGTNMGVNATLEAITFIDGTTVQAHVATGTGNAGNCYEWYTSEQMQVDPEKDYEFSVWVRSTGADQIYFGWHEYNAAGSNITYNPYFHAAARGTNSTWYQIRAILRNWRTPASAGNTEGTDRFATVAAESANGYSSDGVMHSTTRKVHVRLGTCYGSVNGSKTYFHGLRVREIDHDNMSNQFTVPYHNGSSLQGRMRWRTNTHWDNVSGIDIIGAAGEFRMSSDTGTLTLRVDGPIITHDYIRSDYYGDNGGTFLFRTGTGSGTTRHINLANSTSDPSQVGSDTGITAGQRSDNTAYYMIYVKAPYSNGLSTHSRLVLGWHTGVEIGGSQLYGGTRFMNDSPGVSTTELMSVGKGDGNVRVTNSLLVGTTSAYNTLAVTGHLGVNGTTNSSTNNMYDAYVDGNSWYSGIPQARIRMDSSATGTIDQAPVALFIHNENGSDNTWVKLSLGAREAAGAGNTVSLAGIAARKSGGAANSWASGELHLWTKSGGAQNVGMVINSSGHARAVSKLSVGVNNTDLVFGVAGSSHLAGPLYLDNGGVLGNHNTWSGRIQSTGGTTYISTNAFAVNREGYGGGTVFYINTSGGVGIGTTSIGPAIKLDVRGNIRTDSESTATIYQLYTNSGGSLYVGRENSDGSAFGIDAYANFLYTSGTYPLLFLINGSEKMRLTNTGRLGIGNTSPSFTLDASDNTVRTGRIYRSFQSYTGTTNNLVRTWDGVLVAGSDSDAAESYTIIDTGVPQDSYMMGGFTIDWFEGYGSTNAKTQIKLGGYWNGEGNGGFIGWEYTSTNPDIRPTIQIARNSSTGNTAFILSHFAASYAIIMARDLWLGYSSGAETYGSGWTIKQASSTSGYTNFDTVVPRIAPSPTGTGASGTWGINISGNAATATNATNAAVLITNTGGASSQLQYWQLNGNSTLNPDTSYWYALRMSHGDADTYYNATIAVDFFNDDIKFRRKQNGVDQTWRTLLHSGNYNSYSPTLTGTGASGTWGISITGNAANITAYTINQNVGTGNDVQFNRIGLGTSPSYDLHISKATSPSIYLQSGNDDSRVYFTATNRYIAGIPGEAIGIYTESNIRGRYDAYGMRVYGALGVGLTPDSGWTTGEIRASNNITAYSSSDRQLKENIIPISNALKKISRINGVSFDWTQEYIDTHGGEDGMFIRKHDVGVIAQEIEEIIPEIVARRDDGYLAVRYEKIVPLLIQAIKEQQLQIEELKEQLNKL